MVLNRGGIEMTFICKKNCCSCCGPLSFNKELATKHLDKMQGVIKESFDFGDEVLFWTNDNICVFNDRDTKKCLIYDERPDICRKFGVTPNPESPLLYCPHFRPDGREWSAAKSKQIQRAIDAAIKETSKKLEGEKNARKYAKTDITTRIRGIGSSSKVTTGKRA